MQAATAHRRRSATSAAGVLRVRRWMCSALTPLAATGCSGPQSALQTHGPAAAELAHLWWIMLAGATAILALVMGLLLYTLLRRQPRPPPTSVRWLIPAGGLVLPVVVLGALLVYGTGVGEKQLPRSGDDAVRIEVIGHQWWWEVRHPGPGRVVRTVNEVHVPAGRVVHLALGSADVIHSFWVPALAGKLDAIPGRTNVLRLVADAPGVYRGQCAEFCGLRHAHMLVRVIAHPPMAYESWLAEAPSATALPSPGSVEDMR